MNINTELHVNLAAAAYVVARQLAEGLPSTQRREAVELIGAQLASIYERTQGLINNQEAQALLDSTKALTAQLKLISPVARETLRPQTAVDKKAIESAVHGLFSIFNDHGQHKPSAPVPAVSMTPTPRRGLKA